MNEIIEQDTTWLQLASVIGYGRAISLEFKEETHSFVMGGVPEVNIEFSVVQKMHNESSSPRGKHVEKSKLQWHKKYKCFVPQSNKVKLVKNYSY